MKHPLQEIFENTPLPSARKPYHHHITNRTVTKALAVLLGAQGVVCILFTDYIYSVFSYLLGGIMILIGSFDLYKGIITQEFKCRETKLTANGIVMLVLGIVILFRNSSTDTIIGSVWGIIGLSKGVEELNIAIYHRSTKKPFIGDAVYALAELLLAMVLLIDPLGTIRHHLSLLGLELIFRGMRLFKESKKTAK